MTQESNLTTHRAAASVWERPGWDGTSEHRTSVRWMVGVAGAALALAGLRRRSAAGAMLAGFGSWFTWWALTGQCDLSDARRWVSQLADRVGRRRDDLVTEASADSFPASDAPAWTPTVGTGIRRKRDEHAGLIH